MRKNKSNLKKEKIIMLASSVLVLTALTMTGVYVKEKNNVQNDGSIIDFSQLENQVNEKTEDIAKSITDQNTDSVVLDKGNDLDYDPNFTEANSPKVENPSIVDKKVEKDETVLESANNTVVEEEGKEVANNVAQAVNFGERDTLQWPLVGNVLLNYSMDKTIYFATLQQYKYNPAIVIAAVEGEPITAAASGTIVSTFQDEEIGTAIVMDLGNGYELTYGQLKDITVKKGDVIEVGAIIGFVNKPTKYYSVEGCNVYFKLAKDGVPVNPMNRLA